MSTKEIKEQILTFQDEIAKAFGKCLEVIKTIQGQYLDAYEEYYPLGEQNNIYSDYLSADNNEKLKGFLLLGSVLAGPTSPENKKIFIFETKHEGVVVDSNLCSFNDITGIGLEKLIEILEEFERIIDTYIKER